MTLSNWDILTAVIEQIRGLVIVDRESRIVFWNREYSRFYDIDHEQAIGRPVREVISTSKLPVVLESGEPIIGDIFYVGGKALVCNRFPIIKNGEIIGAMSFEVFKRMEEVETFFHYINKLKNELGYYKNELRNIQYAKYSLSEMVGSSQVIQELKRQILKAARSNATVLIFGDTGTGKELVAHALHNESPRAVFPFVKVNCPAIPQELVESELFGYEEGSFTGALKKGKSGKFELANKGTLFLDEVGQLSLATQSKLLRVLQEREIERVGGKMPIPIDVRILAATNSSLEDLVQQGKFRLDLFYRLNVVQIDVPPLSERKTDIPELVSKFISSYCDRSGIPQKKISSEAIELLKTHSWPGNVRELENIIERAIYHSNSNILDVQHFPTLLKRPIEQSYFNKDVSLESLKKEVEHQAILDMLTITKGNKKKAAELLKIDRSLLYQKMRRLGIKY